MQRTIPFANNLKPVFKELIFPEYSVSRGVAIRWLAGAYLVFLFFFFFQAHYPPQGYIPYSPSVWVSPVWKNTLAGALFLGLMLACTPPPAAMRIMHWGVLAVTLAGVLYFSLVVSSRPALALINDRAQALIIASDRLLAGEFPYSESTHLGGPITVLSGSLLLALPSILIFSRPEFTSAALLLAFIILTAVIRSRIRSSIPLFAIWGIALLNPALVRELTLASDLFWGPLLISAAAVLLAFGQVRTGALLFALGVATRLSMAPLLLLWFVGVYILLGKRRATVFSGVTVGTLLLLHVPFIIWDPSTYLQHAPIGISMDKLELQLPPGDNLFADLTIGLLPEGTVRSIVLSCVIFSGALLLGFLTRSFSHLLVLSAALLMGSLVFLGPYFLLDYLVVAVFPLSIAILIEGEREPPGAKGSCELPARGALPPAQARSALEGKGGGMLLTAQARRHIFFKIRKALSARTAQRATFNMWR